MKIVNGQFVFQCVQKTILVIERGNIQLPAAILTVLVGWHRVVGCPSTPGSHGIPGAVSVQGSSGTSGFPPTKWLFDQ